MSRACYSCKHFDFTAGEPGYSEMTPGSDCSFDCGKSHWDYRIGDGFYLLGPRGKRLDPISIREMFEMAETCRDYTPEPIV